MLIHKAPEPRLVLFIVLVILVPGCGTLDNGSLWGQNATLTPSLVRVKSAIVSAAKHPATWSPLLGATILSVGNLDERISEKLAEDNPVFGSRRSADDASDVLRDSLVASVALTALVMPDGDNTKEHAINKTKGLIVEMVAVKSTDLVTNGIKDLAGRERPNRANDKSFPSGHTSRAFAAASLTSKNLESLYLDETVENGIRIGVYSIASATAWARVEAEVHYPTDVLAGAALGNFLSRFIHDAFLGLDQQNTYIEIGIIPGKTQLTLHWDF